MDGASYVGGSFLDAASGDCSPMESGVSLLVYVGASARLLGFFSVLVWESGLLERAVEN